MTVRCDTDDHPACAVPPIHIRPPVVADSATRKAARQNEAAWATIVESPSIPQQPVTSVRFRLRSMLLFITGLSVFFAVLGRFAIDPASLILGLAISTGVAVFGMLCIEASWTAPWSAARHRNETVVMRPPAGLPKHATDSTDLTAPLRQTAQ